MASVDEQILRTSKEIVVKFIEMGRLSPTSFDSTFKEIYRAVYEAVTNRDIPDDVSETDNVGKK